MTSPETTIIKCTNGKQCKTMVLIKKKQYLKLYYKSSFSEIILQITPASWKKKNFSKKKLFSLLATIHASNLGWRTISIRWKVQWLVLGRRFKRRFKKPSAMHYTQIWFIVYRDPWSKHLLFIYSCEAINTWMFHYLFVLYINTWMFHYLFED